jgi:hypothetical protein
LNKEMGERILEERQIFCAMTIEDAATIVGVMREVSAAYDVGSTKHRGIKSMADTAETTAPSPSRAGKKTRGRPARPTPETPQQRIDRLKAELQQAEDAKRALETQRDVIVGKAVVAHALANPDFGRQLAGILRTEVKGKADLAALSELLA